MKKTTLKRTKRLNPVSPRIQARNLLWRKICLERAEYLREKYGRILCEYSKETIYRLSPNGDDLDAGWGHHIDRNRNNCTAENCYIVKYRYHRIITDNNLVVSQEGFEGRK